MYAIPADALGWIRTWISIHFPINYCFLATVNVITIITPTAKCRRWILKTCNHNMQCAQLNWLVVFQLESIKLFNGKLTKILEIAYYWVFSRVHINVCECCPVESCLELNHPVLQLPVEFPSHLIMRFYASIPVQVVSFRLIFYNIVWQATNWTGIMHPKGSCSWLMELL